MLYLLNAFPNSFLPLIAHTSDVPAKKSTRQLSHKEAEELLVNRSFISAIGYKSTADMLSKKFSVEIPENRIEVLADPENDYLVAAFTPPRRLEKNEVFTEEEILKLEIKYFLIF